MKKYLLKQKRAGILDFLQIGNREYLIKNIETGKISIIFYDNKYREDYITGEKLDNTIERNKDNEEVYQFLTK